MTNRKRYKSFYCEKGETPMGVTAEFLIQSLKKSSSPLKVSKIKRFFKTGPGDYSENDQFLGVSLPEIRKIAKETGDLELIQIEELLRSIWHDARMLGFILLLNLFRAASSELCKKHIYEFVLKNIHSMNNWDLVDIAAPTLIGQMALKDPHNILDTFIYAENLWLRRIAIVGTLPAIKIGKFEQILKFALVCKNDREDLIHKACGWMLREVGKKDLAVLQNYLELNSNVLPRTTVRYAIERFSPAQRKQWLIRSKLPMNLRFDPTKTNRIAKT